VLEKGTGLLTRIRPLEPNITWTTATSREVVKHWRLTKNTRKIGQAAGHDAD
jgi:hypothetical protein